VYVTSDPTDANRLFVVERKGRIALTTPTGGTRTFIDLTPLVESEYGERGLLSMAFDPDFAENGLFYVYYTGKDNGAIHIAELQASGDTADLRTWRNVITIQHPDAANHDGGQLQFGPDGYLYAGTGDGGGGGDPQENAQNRASLLGKLIRIDPHRSGNLPYTVPAGNPLVGVAGTRPEIWSLGLRNPFRFSFDRATGDLTIGDVGQNLWEEIDYSPAPNAGRGVNYGWDCREGRHDYELDGCPAGNAGLTEPVLEYPHDNPVDPNDEGCAVTGGYVVRDPGLTELAGRYVYSDNCEGLLRSAVLRVPDAIGDRSEGVRLGNPSSFGEDACGRVYVADLGGEVSRLVDGSPTNCPAIPPPPTEDCTVRLEGDGGRNDLDGGPGSQAIAGRGGDDRLRGGEGNDCIDGGAGADVLSGNEGADILRGGVGGDVLRARDGERDVVVCGEGRDRAIVDHRDRVRGCERKREKAA
jgi:hypothetical protein